MNRPRKAAVITLAEAAQGVLDRWAGGDLADAVRTLDESLQRYRRVLRKGSPRQPASSKHGGRHDRR